MNTAVILAGGFGTRLKEVIGDIPKPMASINGRPFLSFILEQLQQSAVNRVILAVGYKYERIKHHYGSDHGGLRIDYSVESEPLGTGGALRRAIEHSGEESILALNGDTYFEVDLQDLAAFHKEKGADITLALKHMEDVSRFGTVHTNDDQRIVGFTEKGFRAGGHINGGVYVISTPFFESLKLPDAFSFEHDVLEQYYRDSLFYGKACDGYFIDIGVPEDYQQACEYFSSG